MSDFIKRLNKVKEERMRTTDPAELRKLDMVEAQIREDYREAIYCGYMADAMSDFDVEGWD